MPTTVAKQSGKPGSAVPPLQNGDRLTRDEFERRYRAMPEVKKAELIEGVVYMPSPVRTDQHGEPHGMLVTWLGTYAATRPAVQFSDNGTVRLDNDNEPQPDALLRIRESGTSLDVGGYIEGPPELAVEVAASSVSIDMHAKKNAYRRNGVREYLVWRVLDEEVDWFALSNSDYVLLTPGEDGILESGVFSGLRLDVPALLRGDLAAVLRLLATP